jgi:hypothetical protein
MATRRKTVKKVGVVGQIRFAFSKGAYLGTTIGLVLGGSVPVGAYVICHNELSSAEGWRWTALLLLVLGGLLFSAKTVWQWAAAAFQDAWKASGFVVLLEGIMVLAETTWLSWGALGLLIAINGIASGVTLSKGK